MWVRPATELRVVVGCVGRVGVGFQHPVHGIDVGAGRAGFGLEQLALGVPFFRVALLARAQAQALAVPAESELDAGQAAFTGPLGEELAGYFHWRAR